MRSSVLALLAFCGCAATDDAAVTAPVAETFPESWFGTWTGDVAMIGPDGPRMEFQMELTVGPREAEGEYEWTIVYSGEAGESRRPYSLLARDAAEGHFAIDEHNGIVLEARLVPVHIARRGDRPSGGRSGRSRGEG